MATSSASSSASTKSDPVILEHQIALKVTARDNRKGRHTLLVLPGTKVKPEIPDEKTGIITGDQEERATAVIETSVAQITTTPGAVLRFETPPPTTSWRRIGRNVQLMFRLHQPFYDISYLLAFLAAIGSVI